MYEQCKFYQLHSKKILKYLLKIDDNKLFQQQYINSKIEPYIDMHSGKARLIEPPDIQVKIIQTRIKNILKDVIIPENIFSGVPGRSYIQNAQIHKGNRYVYKIDLTAFFPNTSREKVYSFFRSKLETSSDIAEILTNLTTINLDQSNTKNIDEINEFFSSKGIKIKNHLISGAPTSQILSYLVNKDMFDDLQHLSVLNNIIMSIYVDDITFSSSNKISYKFKESVFSIIKNYGHKMSKHKIKSYSSLYPKLITGIVISADGKLTVKNSLRLKIMKQLKILKADPDDISSRQKLRGLVTAAQQVDPNIFPAIRNFAFSKEKN
jgi:RNA-directed DNA polymerase